MHLTIDVRHDFSSLENVIVKLVGMFAGSIIDKLNAATEAPAVTTEQPAAVEAPKTRKRRETLADKVPEVQPSLPIVGSTAEANATREIPGVKSNTSVLSGTLTTVAAPAASVPSSPAALSVGVSSAPVAATVPLSALPVSPAAPAAPVLGSSTTAQTVSVETTRAAIMNMIDVFARNGLNGNDKYIEIRQSLGNPNIATAANDTLAKWYELVVAATNDAPRLAAELAAAKAK